jgi:hypothetical protein
MKNNKTNNKNIKPTNIDIDINYNKNNDNDNCITKYFCLFIDRNRKQMSYKINFFLFFFVFNI